MRMMKGSGIYLRNQVRKNLAKAVVCLFLFALIFFALGSRILFSLSLNIFEAVWLLVSLVPLAGFYFYLHKYQIYSGGFEGEKRVIKLMSGKLSDDYVLLNDLYLRNGGGDIDHVVLGPKGIFVLETKNWRGNISCDGDEWQRPGKRGFRGSPSLQVKRNVAKIKRIIESSEPLRVLDIFVQGVVVFTNRYSRLHLNNPTVLILKLAQLPNYIATYGGSSNYSRQQLEEVGKEILKQKC